MRKGCRPVTRRIGSVARPVVVDAVDRPHGLVPVAEAEDSHKLDFEFLASEPLSRRLEAIAVDLHVVSFLLGVVCEIGGNLPPTGKDVYCRRIRFFRRQSVRDEKRVAETQAAAQTGGGLR